MALLVDKQVELIRVSHDILSHIIYLDVPSLEHFQLEGDNDFCSNANIILFNIVFVCFDSTLNQISIVIEFEPPKHYLISIFNLKSYVIASDVRSEMAIKSN